MYFLSYVFSLSLMFFFFNAPATTEIYTLSLHDALPIYGAGDIGRPRDFAAYPNTARCGSGRRAIRAKRGAQYSAFPDRKSTRLNSSHTVISYAVFCLKKKKK